MNLNYRAYCLRSVTIFDTHATNANIQIIATGESSSIYKDSL